MLSIIYFSFINNSAEYLLLEMFSIALTYYIVSIVIAYITMMIVYLSVSSAFNEKRCYTIFEKIEISFMVLDSHYEQINNLHEFKLKLKTSIGISN